MKYSIIYASKAGGTEQCAKILKDKLFFEHAIPEEEIEIIDLENTANYALSRMEHLIIGSGIYIGKPHKLIREFIEKNLETLLKKKCSLYICSLAEDEIENEKYRNAFTSKFLEHANPVNFFGGVVIFNRLNFLSRFIMRMITKSKKDVHQLKHKVISQFARDITI